MLSTASADIETQIKTATGKVDYLHTEADGRVLRHQSSSTAVGPCRILVSRHGIEEIKDKREPIIIRMFNSQKEEVELTTTVEAYGCPEEKKDIKKCSTFYDWASLKVEGIEDIKLLGLNFLSHLELTEENLKEFDSFWIGKIFEETNYPAVEECKGFAEIGGISKTGYYPLGCSIKNGMSGGSLVIVKNGIPYVTGLLTAIGYVINLAADPRLVGLMSRNNCE